ncbi:hypothetical protein COT48_05920 [Candidatus Woesearchaeota archaeon CG08_land_8_20_14_0_20_47_9]|nr:MAG: hypothetical protein COT48_05920 [Candidatus Woesearchaeota archaeon CG08_land_8_20_14_0_20_47_9]
MLEQLFSADWIERRPKYAFILGFCYAIIGIASSVFIFRSNSGMMAIAFTSLLILPTLNKMLMIEESQAASHTGINLRQIFKDHQDIIEIFVFLFIGIFLVFAIMSFISPQLFTLQIFKPQLAVAGISGQAHEFLHFKSIVVNNLLVLVVCFILSFAYGGGSIVFITWNASVWGSVFGLRARQAVLAPDPLSSFVLFMLPVLPHMITEATSYFSAAVAGGVLSRAALCEKFGSRGFMNILVDSFVFLVAGFLLVVTAAFLEIYIFPFLRG